ncbi:MAG: hypothetical protein M3Q97_06225 [Bacteroidota bacterium]|nr:hypothetical protein [Bacteroidota bacterium]
MSEKEKIKHELESIAPFLSGLPKKEEEKAPDGYFQALEDKVMSRIEENKTIVRKVRPAWGAIAAAAVIILAMGWLLVSHFDAFEKKLNRISYNKTIEDSIRIANEEMIVNQWIDEVEADIFLEALTLHEDNEDKSSEHQPQSQRKKVFEEYILENIEETYLNEEL